MTMQLVEESYTLWRLLGFRLMVRCTSMSGPTSAEYRRLWRLHERAAARYFRRKRAIGGSW